MVPSRTPRYDAIDLARGFSCLIVVLFHATAGYFATPELEARLRQAGGSWSDWLVLITSRLWVGVPFFFVISGYCIAASAESASRKPWSAGRFFYRRFRRIYPPLWAYLLLCAIGIACLSPAALPGPTPAYLHPIPYPQDVPLGQWLGSITLTEEWRHYVGGPPRGYFTGQVWTLCYEEQFYLVMGVIVAVARRWLFPAVAVLTFLVYLNIDPNLLRQVGDAIGVDLDSYRRPLPGFFFDGLWLAFAAGVGVYYRIHFATPVVRRALDAMMVLGILWAARTMPTPWDFKPTLPGYLGASFVFALILGWLYPYDAAITRHLASAPFAWAGRMCYSLYLIHAPVTAVIGWNLYRAGLTTTQECILIVVPISTAASLGLSWPFHCWVERRFLNAPLPSTPSPPAAG